MTAAAGGEGELRPWKKLIKDFGPVMWSLQVEGSSRHTAGEGGDEILKCSWRPGDHGGREGGLLAWTDAWVREALCGWMKGKEAGTQRLVMPALSVHLDLDASISSIIVSSELLKFYVALVASLGSQINFGSWGDLE